MESKAITILNESRLPKLKGGGNMDIRSLIRERRSIRKYEDREVPQELLARIPEDVLWALCLIRILDKNAGF